MLIHNYGLFWRREDVFWGRPHVEGHLKGRAANALAAEPVDFRHQQGVYVLYDEAFTLLYVGQTGMGHQRLLVRLRQHTKDALADRWTRFSWFGVRRVLQCGQLSVETNAAHPTRSEALNHIEAILISAAEPPHNRQGGRFGEGVDQYLQYRDVDALGPTVEDMIKSLWKNRDSTGSPRSLK